MIRSTQLYLDELNGKLYRRIGTDVKIGDIVASHSGYGKRVVNVEKYVEVSKGWFSKGDMLHKTKVTYEDGTIDDTVGGFFIFEEVGEITPELLKEVQTV